MARQTLEITDIQHSQDFFRRTWKWLQRFQTMQYIIVHYEEGFNALLHVTLMMPFLQETKLFMNNAKELKIFSAKE